MVSTHHEQRAQGSFGFVAQTRRIMTHGSPQQRLSTQTLVGGHFRGSSCTCIIYCTGDIASYDSLHASQAIRSEQPYGFVAQSPKHHNTRHPPTPLFPYRRCRSTTKQRCPTESPSTHYGAQRAKKYVYIFKVHILTYVVLILRGGVVN